MEEDCLSGVIATLARHGYSYLSLIGVGGFSSVYKVNSTKYCCEFAAKVILQQNSPTQRVEISSLKQLNNPNIITIFDFFEDEKYLYIILEYCHGGSFQNYVENNGPLRKEKLYTICSKLLVALKHCHENGIAHRDIKPGNVLMDQYGRPKLSDFGLSQYYTDNYEDQNFPGSKPYMCPNLIKRTAYDPFAADIWALGLTFFFLAYGKLPWSKDGIERDHQIIMSMLYFPSKPMQDPDFIFAIKSMLNTNFKKRATLDWLIKLPIFNPTQFMCTQSTVSSLPLITKEVGISDQIVTPHSTKLENSKRMKHSKSTVMNMICQPKLTRKCVNPTSSIPSFKRQIRYLMDSISPNDMQPPSSLLCIEL